MDQVYVTKASDMSLADVMSTQDSLDRRSSVSTSTEATEKDESAYGRKHDLVLHLKHFDH